jgi:hypothetical protein
MSITLFGRPLHSADRIRPISRKFCWGQAGKSIGQPIVWQIGYFHHKGKCSKVDKTELLDLKINKYSLLDSFHLIFKQKT